MLNTQSHVRALKIAAMVLLVISIGVHLIGNFPIYRLLRGVVSLAFLGIVIVHKRKEINVLLVSFLCIYAASSIATVWYENQFFGVLSLILNFLAYLILIRALWPKAAFKKLGPILTLVFIGLLVINAYLLYQFILMLRGFAESNTLYYAMLLGAMSLVIVTFLVLLYNHTCSTKASLIFTVAIFLFVFAELLRAIGYYDFGFGNIPVYLARTLLIVGTGLLAHYMLLNKTADEELAHKIF